MRTRPYEEFSALGSSNEEAVDVNNHGVIVGNSTMSDGSGRGWVRYADGTVVDIGTLMGLPNVKVVGISDGGVVAGSRHIRSTVVSDLLRLHLDRRARDDEPRRTELGHGHRPQRRHDRPYRSPVLPVARRQGDRPQRGTRSRPRRWLHPDLGRVDQRSRHDRLARLVLGIRDGRCARARRPRHRGLPRRSPLRARVPDGELDRRRQHDRGGQSHRTVRRHRQQRRRGPHRDRVVRRSRRSAARRSAHDDRAGQVDPAHVHPVRHRGPGLEGRSRRRADRPRHRDARRLRQRRRQRDVSDAGGPTPDRQRARHEQRRLDVGRLSGVRLQRPLRVEGVRRRHDEHQAVDPEHDRPERGAARSVRHQGADRAERVAGRSRRPLDGRAHLPLLHPNLDGGARRHPSGASAGHARHAERRLAVRRPVLGADDPGAADRHDARVQRLRHRQPRRAVLGRWPAIHCRPPATRSARATGSCRWTARCHGVDRHGGVPDPAHRHDVLAAAVRRLRAAPPRRAAPGGRRPRRQQPRGDCRPRLRRISRSCCRSTAKRFPPARPATSRFRS